MVFLRSIKQENSISDCIFLGDLFADSGQDIANNLNSFFSSIYGFINSSAMALFWKILSILNMIGVTIVDVFDE